MLQLNWNAIVDRFAMKFDAAFTRTNKKVKGLHLGSYVPLQWHDTIVWIHFLMLTDAYCTLYLCLCVPLQAHFDCVPQEAAVIDGARSK
jgi:hypothetical protein